MCIERDQQRLARIQSNGANAELPIRSTNPHTDYRLVTGIMPFSLVIVVWFKNLSKLVIQD